jgi:hypothetical protein
MLGFETIGNATLIVHDGKPLLATDPWLGGSCYFGSWTLPYEIPEAQRQSIIDCQYVWLSHGHPDHIHSESLENLRNCKILVPDHFGSRVYEDLSTAGFDVTVLVSGQSLKLSDRVSICSFADFHQDAALVVKIGNTVVANLNDCSPEGFYWSRQVRRLLEQGRPSFLLKKTTYRDADMTNFFDDDDVRIEPDIRHDYISMILKFWCDLLHPDFFIPFSHFHFFQRSDSSWANKFVETDMAFTSETPPKKTEILQAFVRYDVTNDNVTSLNPQRQKLEIHPPEEFGDSWSDDLTTDDKSDIERYFKRAELIHKDINFVTIRAGNSETTVELTGGRFLRGLIIETPRNSFCEALRHEVFDDILIGNFAKFRLVGDWNGPETYPYLQPTLPRFVDNGRAYTEDTFADYREHYRKSAPRDFAINALQRSLQMKVRPMMEKHPRIFKASARLLSFVRSHV